jgi:hypothetical protein
MRHRLSAQRRCLILRAEEKETENSFLFATAPRRKEPPYGHEAAAFGCRPDTLRERLVNALHRRYRKQVASEQLINAVYGARSKHASHSITSLSSPLRDGTLTLGSFFELNLLKK